MYPFRRRKTATKHIRLLHIYILMNFYDFARLLGNFPQFPVTVQTAGKLTRKAASSSLVSGFPCQFSHRMDIRCFPAGLFRSRR
ncbi:hypothetical protein CLOSTASPAR_00657 [[Clostridium] asparagiforme DSM 15981]|uniref:Uncharacterized protein n=1 Tax=[Clostridium] asparagiforme DSM 15981 TaxID=518636 RepID=C0CUG7_9FIRM|nr:hypothetical protein CLOSTASPAR_00657 [[Clostridium] asparagiforme DSM 15981]